MKVLQRMGRTIVMLSFLVPLELFAAIHYVDLNSATPIAPYTNWTTAATGIQQAVDASINGDTVLITNGTYRLSAQINVTKDIRIESVNGANVTLVDGGGVVRCFNLGTTRSILSGLTITNGFTAGDGGGIYCISTNPIVTKCVITGNSAVGCGGGMRYGTANTCTINGNSASDDGGGMYYGIAKNCTIMENSAASYGGGLYEGTANNCAIKDNSSNRGGGLYGGVANNCSIIDNSADWCGGVFGASGIHNSIIWRNTGANLINTSPTYSCSPDVEHGVNGNITNTPSFISFPHIFTNSPCRGAGSSAYATGTDINGEIWLDPPSMGCDEIHGMVTGAVHLSISGPVRICAGFEGKYISEITGPVTGYQLDFGFGTVVNNAPRPTRHAWSSPGDYEMILTAYNDDYPSGISFTQNIEVVTADGSAIYISEATGSDFNDGLSWSAAKKSIQAGVDAQEIYGGIVLVSNGTYTVDSEIVVNKTVVIQSKEGPEVTIVEGGGSNRCFNLECSDCIISGLTITNGYSSDNGGGIYCLNASPVVTNCTVAGNSAEQFGGGMYRGTAKNGTFTGNSADYGGGLCEGTANNCIITGNSAYDGGGMRGGTANNCTISRNSAGDGGGISRGTANNCVISGNLAGEGGGMAFGTANNCIITGNVSTTGPTAITRGGGGLYESTANNCTISGNSAVVGGGGCIVTATNCVITGNSAETGGGLYDGRAYNCTITGNSAPYGGGISFSGANNCTINGNSADYGGGIYDGWAKNCSISANTATFEGGGMCYGSAENCAITGNSASEGGGSFGGANTRLDNCIIWYNTADIFENITSSPYARYRPTHCCSPDLEHGIDGNITNAPLLVSASHIAVNSPCIGAGDPAKADGTDLHGEAWLNPPSMGCDEIHGAVTGALHFAISGPLKVHLGFEATYFADIKGGITGYQLDFGDGTILTNAVLLSHAWNLPGVYDTILTAYNEDYPAGLSFSQRVEVVSADESAIHVSEATGNDANDGLSWLTAKKSIQSGVDAQLVDGGTVWVSNGTYAVDFEILVGRGITIRSLEGPKFTTVNGGGVTRCFNLGNWDVVLSGFTITNGYSPDAGGGIYCTGVTPEVTNCTITGNSVDLVGGGMHAGTANNCLIIGNSVKWYGGGGLYESMANNCMIVGNSAGSFGGGMTGGTANNCTIIGNSAEDYGGGLYEGTANNSIIWNNTAKNQENGVMNNSCSPDAVHGSNGNTTNAPLFVDAANGNYHLQSNSPCINWGNNSYVNSPVDLDGNPREVGAYVDMGAYEYQTDLGADGDHDGMPDEWERSFFGYNILPQENADNDAHSNVDEYIAGTDPTNSTSYFMATGSVAETNGTNGFVVEWISIPDRLYSVQWSTNLVAGFQTLETGIEHPQNSYIDTTHRSASNGFYKVDVRLK